MKFSDRTLHALRNLEIYLEWGPKEDRNILIEWPHYTEKETITYYEVEQCIKAIRKFIKENEK